MDLPWRQYQPFLEGHVRCAGRSCSIPGLNHRSRGHLIHVLLKLEPLPDSSSTLRCWLSHFRQWQSCFDRGPRPASGRPTMSLQTKTYSHGAMDRPNRLVSFQNPACAAREALTNKGLGPQLHGAGPQPSPRLIGMSCRSTAHESHFCNSDKCRNYSSDFVSASLALIDLCI